ncbi:MAG: single-stranded DNA-binding protein [Rhodocyclales bacterium]|nr:single-stranded DNA-binding protein [Rhodocyclales bacterium]
MASSQNLVILIGNLGRDPEVRYTPQGDPVATVSLATTERRKDKRSGEWVEDSEWHRVVLFKRLAEVAAEYLIKGSTIGVTGKLRTRKWTDKDGVERYSTEVLAYELRLLGGKRKESANNAQIPTGEAKALTPEEMDDIPF